ncbi:MAG: hypothetical protein HKO69_08045 [Woeseiaceae bacterium]|nr:hypothetical protein [Woeseiaceae bacterium]
MSSYFKCLLLIVAGAFLFAGCEGDDGAAGAAGTPGQPGTAGGPGVSCWDLDQDGIADPEEDLNGDTIVDVLDCREPPPGTAILVSGAVTTPNGPLDRFATVAFTPATGVAIEADVANDGTYSVELAEGDYVATASRPGYDDLVFDPFTVVDGAVNTLDFDLPEVPDGEYLGSSQCGLCHTVQYASFKETGHPFKLNKTNGEQPTYPFTTLNGVLEQVFDDDTLAGDTSPGTDNSLGTPATWGDVSYVIGGYYWKARLVDQAGAIVTGSAVQYNFATKAMASYNNDSVDKPYNCGNCHTTGWRHQDDALNDARQDNLTFMDGTFFKGGIQCESCHGAGASHAKFTGVIVRDAVFPRSDAELAMADAGYGDAVACGECHTRDGERDYPTYVSAFETALGANPDPRPYDMGGRIAASGGMVRHHEQYDEVLGIDPDTLDTVRTPEFLGTHGNCNTCHNPHGSSVNADNPAYTGMPGVDKTNDGCLGCHNDYDPALRGPGMQSLNCIDCHMPYLAKSAVATPAEADKPAIGDVSSHIFKIVLDSTADQFTADGKYAYPAIDEAWACRTCHNSAPGAVSFPVPDGSVDAYIFHNNLP